MDRNFHQEDTNTQAVNFLLKTALKVSHFVYGLAPGLGEGIRRNIGEKIPLQAEIHQNLSTLTIQGRIELKVLIDIESIVSEIFETFLPAVEDCLSNNKFYYADKEEGGKRFCKMVLRFFFQTLEPRKVETGPNRMAPIIKAANLHKFLELDFNLDQDENQLRDRGEEEFRGDRLIAAAEETSSEGSSSDEGWEKVSKEKL